MRTPAMAHPVPRTQYPRHRRPLKPLHDFGDFHDLALLKTRVDYFPSCHNFVSKINQNWGDNGAIRMVFVRDLLVLRPTGDSQDLGMVVGGCPEYR